MRVGSGGYWTSPPTRGLHNAHIHNNKREIIPAIRKIKKPAGQCLRRRPSQSGKLRPNSDQVKVPVSGPRDRPAGMNNESY